MSAVGGTATTTTLDPLANLLGNHCHWSQRGGTSGSVWPQGCTCGRWTAGRQPGTFSDHLAAVIREYLRRGGQ